MFQASLRNNTGQKALFKINLSNIVQTSYGGQENKRNQFSEQKPQN